MNEALKIIQENRAIRDEEAKKADKKVIHKSKQTLQEKIENAAMIANRYGTPMDEAQSAMGMTEQQIENFRRN